MTRNPCECEGDYIKEENREREGGTSTNDEEGVHGDTGSRVVRKGRLMPGVEWSTRREALPQDVLAEVVAHALAVVGGVLGGRDAEDLVELFERESLRFRNEEQDEECADGVPAGVWMVREKVSADAKRARRGRQTRPSAEKEKRRTPAEGTLRREGREEARESEGDDLRRSGGNERALVAVPGASKLTKLKSQVVAVAYDMPTSRT